MSSFPPESVAMYVKILLTLLVLLMAGLVLLLARPRPVEPPLGSPNVPSPLDAPVAELRLRDTALEQAVAELQRRAKMPLLVKWDQLQAAGRRRDTHVNADLHDVTLLAALRVLFEQHEPPDASGWPAEVQYEAVGGVVIVFDPRREDAQTVVRIYDVRDLVENADRDRYGSSNGWSRSPAERFRDFAYMIEIAANHGTLVGGPSRRTTRPSFVTGWGGRLIVADTPEVQQKVQLVLRQFRETKEAN